MKYLLLIPFLFSIGSFAQDVDYKYEPVVNKAEYYIATFKNGKDLDDMAMWYKKFADWAEDQGDGDAQGGAPPVLPRVVPTVSVGDRGRARHGARSARGAARRIRRSRGRR